ncbi:ParB N-terminal domain-containing protein, partial [Acinetobacter baumannii]|uniref:ParB N-terminal domain-containing protein n=1 Tax=Acinetobacter baumannii TaxID=470 RepID=UPI000A4FB3FB
TIKSSIRELGVIEPLAVHPEPVMASGIPSYILLDGHLRLEALKTLGGTEALRKLDKEIHGSKKF